MKIRAVPDQVVILTYNRPTECLRLLQDFVAQKGTHAFQVQVWDDCSTSDYTAVKRLVKKQKWKWVSAPQNHGKRLFWQWVSAIYKAQEPLNATFWVLLPDDVRLCQRFWPKALETWNGIDDPRKTSLTLLVDKVRDTMACWTGVPPERRGNVDHIAWVDGAALVNRIYFNTLQWKCPEVPANRWRRDATVSSGVGAGITHALHRRSRTMYRSRESLLVHVHTLSQMNPEIRARDDMGVIRFADGDEEARRLMVTDKVTASLATLPDREGDLQLVVASLLPQVDQLNIFLNGHAAVPAFLDDPKIVVHHRPTNIGDQGKFFWAESTEGFCFHCDDDLIYPPDYVTTLIRHIEARSRKVAVSVHGRIFKRKINSYYRSCEKGFHCLRDVTGDHSVDVLGTGALAFHSSTVQVKFTDFKAANMGDVWFALLCKAQAVPRIALGHPATWLKLTNSHQANTIYRKLHANDKRQTDLVKAVAPWKPLPDPIPYVQPRGRRGRPAARVRGRGAAVAPGVVPTLEISSVYWDKRVKAFSTLSCGHPSWDGPAWSRQQKRIWKFFNQHWHLRGTVLDFGCGVGRYESEIKAKGHNIVAVDSSIKMIEDAQRRKPGMAQYLLSQQARIPLRDNSVDSLFVSEVFGHIEDAVLPHVIAEIRRVLKPRGRMMVFENTQRATTVLDASRRLFRRKPLAYQTLVPGLAPRSTFEIEGEQYTLLSGSLTR